MGKTINNFIASLVIACCLFLISFAGCGKQEKHLTVYIGKGLQSVMEEIIPVFERNYDVRIHTVYGGSETLLRTIKKSRKGDIYIPGSVNFLKESGELVLHHQYVAHHVPIFIIRKDNPNAIQTFEDLLKPGMRLAVGNKDMCAVGRVANNIITASDLERDFTNNITITGTTVNELLNLVLRRDVDAALVWTDMLTWPEAEDLQGIVIPEKINKLREIHVAVLSTTTDKETAALFADFVATEGKSFFKRNGFGEK